VRAYLAVVFARALARMSPRRLERVLLRRRFSRSSAAAPPDAVVDAVDYVLGSGWRFVRRGCLTRGIALYELLASGRDDLALVFGVDRTLAADGHCWLEQDGEPVHERVDPRASFMSVWQIRSTVE
jgi:transglutaminase superfamily protein